MAARELSGPEVVRNYYNAFNQENSRIWFKASFNRSPEAALRRMEPRARGVRGGEGEPKGPGWAVDEEVLD